MPSPVSRRPDPERQVVVRQQLIDPEHPELGSREVPSPGDWLWQGRIRTGDFVVVVGDRASGKTTLLCDWMARVTSGQPFPGDPPSMTREPGEVLLFNGFDKFTETIQTRVRKSGGDPGRVSLVTRDLQKWSGVPGEIPEDWRSFDNSTYNSKDCRAELHLKKSLEWLRTFLRNRPKTQMVVIDNAWQHIRADSERRLAPTIYELAHIARENEVTLVLSQTPNAYRQGTGAAEFIKSDSILDAARSIWRTMTPGDPSVPARNVQCLKLSQTPTIPKAGQPWSIFLGPGEVLQWKPGAGPLYSNTKRAQDDRMLGNSLRYIRNFVRRVGGVIEYNTLRIATKKAGIPQKWFMQSILLPVFEIDYEPYGEDELIQIIGFPEALEKRRNAPHPKPLKISNPPGGAASTADELPYHKQLANWINASNAPPDPMPACSTPFPNPYDPGQWAKQQQSATEPANAGAGPEQALPADTADSPKPPPKSRAPRETINLRKESWEEREDRRYSELIDAFCQSHLGTPAGWTPPQTQAEWETFCEGALGYFAERMNISLPKELPFDLLTPLADVLGDPDLGRKLAPDGVVSGLRSQTWGDVVRRLDRDVPKPRSPTPASPEGETRRRPAVPPNREPSASPRDRPAHQATPAPQAPSGRPPPGAASQPASQPASRSGDSPPGVPPPARASGGTDPPATPTTS